MSNSDYMPPQRAAFYDFQNNLIGVVKPLLADWKIPKEDFTKIEDLQTPYLLAYSKSSNKGTRSQADIRAHDDARAALETGLRGFIKQYLTGNPLVTNEQKVQLGLNINDEVLTQRPAIDIEPTLKLTATAGARIQVECRNGTDTSRPSMHPQADTIELRYIIATTAPATPSDCNQNDGGSKAKFFVEASIADAGKKFYGFVRWRNDSDKTKSGPWSKLGSATIIE